MKTMFTLLAILLAVTLAPTLANAASCSLTAGQAYKSNAGKAVYYITEQCTKRAFTRPQLFFSYFNSWQDALAVNEETLHSIPSDKLGFMPWGPKYDPQYGALVKTVNDPKVYLLLDKQKFWIASENIFNALHYSWGWIEDVDDGLLNKYALGSEINYTDHHPNYTLVKYADSPKVYRLEPDPKNNAKQIKAHVKDAATFKQLGFRWDRIVLIDKTETYSNGSVLSSVCGNGAIDATEECDGESYCGADCKFASQYKKITAAAPGGYTDFSLPVGGKLAIDGQINIRIDNIAANLNSAYGTRVDYSIWGRDNFGACQLISTAGEFWTKLDEFKFREFTNAFVELLGADDNNVNLRVFTGEQAEQRCKQLAGWKKDIACSFYPTNSTVYIQNDKFRIYLTANHNQELAHYVIDAMENCRAKMEKKIPALSKITPFGERWTIFPMLAGGEVFSSDYQRISVGPTILSYPGSLSNLFAEIKNNRCPMEKSYLAHELVHLLFANTMLQDIYDGGRKKEFNDNRPGSLRLSEGLATFIPYYISKDDASVAVKHYNDNNVAVCGANVLINHNHQYDGATAEQLNYANVLAGSGYKSNYYDVGFCFYKRVENDCGEQALDYLFTEQINVNGSMVPQKTMFKQLADKCGEDKIKKIMLAFGFDYELLNIQQQNPLGGFADEVDQLGCL